MDYGEIYYQEKYIFETVSERFQRSGSVDAFDFFCIVIWKSNRSKSKIARRLARGYPNLEAAVSTLTQKLAAQPTHKDRLHYLMISWGFRLPMASAILTVFYPDAFTIYDYRVRATLSCPPIKISRNFDLTWDQYQNYVERVRQAIPDNRSLRDKDRYLWGRSFYDQLQWDIQHNFGTTVGNSTEDEDV